ncbi:uncharacterized protein [Euphorbia lathyris]|uniref:uncharacterized protein n=1 Tax=Euphorbia lathyris TaxID=212925 RepID=UPI0033132EE4
MDSDAQADNLPDYYMLQIKNFSALIGEVNKYESAIFEAKGYKWKLVIYPKGNGLKEVKHHISLYLELIEKLEPDQMVYAVFRLYLLDQKNNNDFVLPGTFLSLHFAKRIYFIICCNGPHNSQTWTFSVDRF